MHGCIKNSHALIYIPAIYCERKRGVTIRKPSSTKSQLTSADPRAAAPCSQYVLYIVYLQQLFRYIVWGLLSSKAEDNSPCFYVYSITIYIYSRCAHSPVLTWILSSNKRRTCILSSLIISQRPPLFLLSFLWSARSLLLFFPVPTFSHCPPPVPYTDHSAENRP